MTDGELTTPGDRPDPPPLDLRARLEREIERAHAACHGWAMSCCAWDRARAEDVLQEAYLKVLDGRARFDGKGSFRSWIFGVIRFTALEAHRRVKRRTRLLEVFGRRSTRPVVEAEHGDALESPGTDRLREALGELAERQREVLHLVFYEEMTIAEAADVMGVPLGTARTHYARGKKALRKRLTPRDEGDA